jgi:hypothetical protein
LVEGNLSLAARSELRRLNLRGSEVIQMSLEPDLLREDLNKVLGAAQAFSAGRVVTLGNERVPFAHQQIALSRRLILTARVEKYASSSV